MLIARIPCLDKGFVAYLDSSGDSSKLKDVALEFFKKTDGTFLSSISSLTLVMKCPLFVQLNLGHYNLKVISTPSSEVEAYVPNVGEVGCSDLGSAKVIAEDMERTTAALLLNPKAYQADGCDRFASQILTPISVYTTLIVHGPHSEWTKFAAQNKAPKGIAPYVNAVQQIMQMEWKGSSNG